MCLSNSLKRKFLAESQTAASFSSYKRGDNDEECDQLSRRERDCIPDIARTHRRCSDRTGLDYKEQSNRIEIPRAAKMLLEDKPTAHPPAASLPPVPHTKAPPTL